MKAPSRVFLGRLALGLAGVAAIVSNLTLAGPPDGVELVLTKSPFPSASIALQWSGAAPPYEVFRSTMAQTATDAGNKIAETAASSYEDTPPEATVLFYVVVAGCPAGTVRCGPDCVDVTTDPLHCGGCGISCGAGSCVSGTCTGSEPPGSLCADPTECGSGFCVDGVCCASACSGLCETCAAVGREGSCDPVPAGQDPASECASDPAATCDQTGQCGGNRSCQLHATGTVCAAATCAGSTTSQRADTCDGEGTCVDGGTQGCSPYVCDSSTGSCRTSCSLNTHCAPGYACKTSTGQCLLLDGSSCSLSSQCLNNACCTGICRNPFTDKNNCGQCGLVCQDRNAVSNVCSAGTCIPTCVSGFSNCDGNPANGCERCLESRDVPTR